MNLLGALPSPALHAKESRNKTSEEDNFDGGEISGHLWRREKDGNEFQEPEERRRCWSKYGGGWTGKT